MTGSCLATPKIYPTGGGGGCHILEKFARPVKNSHSGQSPNYAGLVPYGRGEGAVDKESVRCVFTVVAQNADRHLTVPG